MTTMRTIRRVTVYADSVIEKSIVEHCMELGAKGYTTIECRGRGQHETCDDPFTGSTRVKIELLVNAPVAEKIVEYLTASRFRGKAVAVCVESVDVASFEEF